MTIPTRDDPAISSPTASPTLADYAQQFADPPKAYSPVPIWWWSGDTLTRERLRWQLEQLTSGGVYNVVILNLAPTGPLYGSDPDRPAFLTDAWWTLFRGVCDDAAALGMRLWFYDQLGFSGANLQADLVREHGDYGGLALESLTASGAGPLELTCPAEGQPLAAFYTPSSGGQPVRVALEGGRARTSSGGQLRLVYSAPRGFDYFSPEACRALLDTVHGAFERELSAHFGSVIVGSFQDELPNLPSWGRTFADAFYARQGYDLQGSLYALWDGTDAAAQTVRADYQAVRSALAEEAFFKPLFAWHERHGLLCGVDQQGPARSGQPLGTVQLYADYLRTHRWFGAPGSDHHGNAKIHSSLAHLYGRERVWTEAFHSSGWGGTLEETFDWLLPWLGAGATLYDPHAVYYSTWGGWWEWAPPSTCWRQPYWRHYPVFASAIGRLSYLLSQGQHVCDVGVLHPTTTVQAHLSASGAPIAAGDDESAAQRANDVYEAVVGTMMFLTPEPGVLERDRRDFDVLDDASVQAGAVVAGHLQLGAERFAAVVLPACSVLEAATAAKLVAFVAGGGLLVAIGAAPQLVLGDAALQTELEQLFGSGRAHLLAEPDDLPTLLRPLGRRVEAPVPVLHRRLGVTEAGCSCGCDLLYIPAAFPHASRTEDAAATWLKADYSFDPARYARTVTVSVQGFRGRPELWDPLSGSRTPLTSTRRGDRTEVVVPFEHGPAALVVWSLDAAMDPPLKTSQCVLQTLPQTWNFTLEPTLDNRYGDFAKPDFVGAPPVQTWAFEQELGAETQTVQATFGRYGFWTGPSAAEALPDPSPELDPDLTPPLAEGWQGAVYSLQRGLYKDALHVPNLGPKGHVPEEFLAFGPVAAGAGVQFRTVIAALEQRSVWLALGAGAAKTVWLGGVPVTLEDAGGYLGLAPVTLQAGSTLLEFRLVNDAVATADLRAYYAFITDPAAFARPERMTIPGASHKDSRVGFALDFDVPFLPESLTVQVAADTSCAVLLNGRVLGRQGGFDPYYSLARVQPYTTAQVSAGHHTLSLTLQDSGQPLSVLVDAVVAGAAGERLTLLSGPHWAAQRDGGRPQPVALVRQPWLDPAWSCLTRRPPPLPGTLWLEDRPDDGTVLPLIPNVQAGNAQAGAATPERFRWTLPVGATQMDVPVAGDVRVWVGDAELPGDGSGYALPPSLGQRRAVLEVTPEPGRTGGGVFDGPVTYTLEGGQIDLGAWAEQGLETYSGGVRYSTTFTLETLPDGDASLELDLGRVRGTAEVWLNGQPLGVRILSPYRFALGGAAKAGDNRLEVLVLNTLAPYLDAVSPTHYIRPGQTVSGLFGPVRLLHLTPNRTINPVGVFPATTSKASEQA